MIIPLGTDRPLSRPTVVAYALVGVNIVVYCMGLALDRAWGGGVDSEPFERVQRLLILDPMNIRPWSVLSYAFLHGNFLHLLGNMLFLWVFGPNVEDRFGRIGFLLFYLGGAAASGGLHALFDTSPVLGASGAIAAVTGAYVVLFPRTNVKILFLLLIIGIYQIPAWWFIAGQVAFDIWRQGTAQRSGVAHLAHLGGYAFGGGVSLLLLATGILKREMYDLFSISKHAARRRQFQEAARVQAKAAAQRTAAAAPSGSTDQLALARAEVTTPLAAGDLAAAIAGYRRLLDAHGVAISSALLSRKSQYDLANALFAAGDHTTAATAYTLFLEGYPKDSEIPTVRLMLGLINARYLNDPVKAKQEIHEAMPGLPDGDYKQLARELLAELG